MKTNRIVLMILTFVLCTLLMAPAFSYGETGAVNIASKTSFQVGDTLAVTVKYSASSLGHINGQLIYDPDLLQYVSGGSGGNDAGIVQLDKGMDGQSTQLFTVRFKALAEGTDYLQVQTIELVDLDERDLGNPGASVKYTIKAAPTNDNNDTNSNDNSTVTPGDSTTGNSDNSAGNGGDVAQPTTEKAPDTIWIYAGAIAVTLILLIIAVAVTRHKRK